MFGGQVWAWPPCSVSWLQSSWYPSPLPLGPGANRSACLGIHGPTVPPTQPLCVFACVCPVSPRAQASSLPSDWGLPIRWADLPTSWSLWVMPLPTPAGQLQEVSPPLSSPGPLNFFPASLPVWHPLWTPLGPRDFFFPAIYPICLRRNWVHHLLLVLFLITKSNNNNW